MMTKRDGGLPSNDDKVKEGIIVNIPKFDNPNTYTAPKEYYNFLVLLFQLNLGLHLYSHSIP